MGIAIYYSPQCHSHSKFKIIFPSLKITYQSQKINKNHALLPCQLAQPKDLALRQVANGDLSVERHQMMLTHGEHFDVLDNDHLISILVKYGVVQNLWNIKNRFISKLLKFVIICVIYLFLVLLS